MIGENSRNGSEDARPSFPGRDIVMNLFLSDLAPIEISLQARTEKDDATDHLRSVQVVCFEVFGDLDVYRRIVIFRPLKLRNRLVRTS